MLIILYLAFYSVIFKFFGKFYADCIKKQYIKRTLSSDQHVGKLWSKTGIKILVHHFKINLNPNEWQILAIARNSHVLFQMSSNKQRWAVLRRSTFVSFIRGLFAQVQHWQLRWRGALFKNKYWQKAENFFKKIATCSAKPPCTSAPTT